MKGDDPLKRRHAELAAERVANPQDYRRRLMIDTTEELTESVKGPLDGWGKPWRMSHVKIDEQAGPYRFKHRCSIDIEDVSERGFQELIDALREPLQERGKPWRMKEEKIDG